MPSGTRSEALDLEALKALSSARLKYLVYAPESGSSRTLAEIKKKIKLEKMEESIKWAIKQNISVRANLIIGFPKEKRLQVYRTLYQQLKFMFMGVEEAPIFLFQPYPGTELFHYLIDKGEIIINDEYFDSLNTLSNGELRPPSQTFNIYMSRYENLNTYLSFPYMGHYLCRGYRRDFRPQRKLLYNVDINCCIYGRKGGFVFAVEQPLRLRDESSLHE